MIKVVVVGSRGGGGLVWGPKPPFPEGQTNIIGPLRNFNQWHTQTDRILTDIARRADAVKIP